MFCYLKLLVLIINAISMTRSLWYGIPKLAWVGLYSRWGSIISLSALDWGCIRNLKGWGCNQEWGSIRADTVFQIHFIPKSLLSFPLWWQKKLVSKWDCECWIIVSLVEISQAKNYESFISFLLIFLSHCFRKLCRNKLFYPEKRRESSSQKNCDFKEHVIARKNGNSV